MICSSSNTTDANLAVLAQEAAKEHDSCTNNLYNGLKELGMELTEDPRCASALISCLRLDGRCTKAY